MRDQPRHAVKTASGRPQRAKSALRGRLRHPIDFEDECAAVQDLNQESARVKHQSSEQERLSQLERHLAEQLDLAVVREPIEPAVHG